MNVHYPELFSTESIIKIISLLDSLMNIQLLNDHLIGGRSTTLHSRMEDSKTKLGKISFSFKRGGSSYIPWLAFSRYVHIKN